MGVSAARVTGRRGCCFSAVGLLAQPTLPRRALRGAASGRFGWPAAEENFAVCRFRLGAVSNFAAKAHSDSVEVVRGQGSRRTIS